MGRKFRIVVNGEAYEVEVEECSASTTHFQTAPISRPAPIAPQTVPTPIAPVVKTAPVAVTPKVETAKPVAAGAGSVICPMPGTVLDVKVKVGDTVKLGQPVLILEAMKMENDIAATTDGTVQQILVTKGATVNAGALLVVIG